MDINNIFGNLSLAIETFRWSVKSLFPVFTKAAWTIKKNDILKAQPTATSRNFRYKMRKVNYYQEFGKKHRKPGVFSNVLSWFILVLPKAGPLKSLKIKEPGPVAEKLFIQSFDTVLMQCNTTMKILNTDNIDFTNIDFDTGNNTAAGEYNLADKTYSTLLLNLYKKEFNLLNSALKQNIIEFYSNAIPTGATKKERREWNKLNVALVQLRIHKPLIQ